MRRRMVTSFVAVAFLLLSLPVAQAEVPGQFNYQGYLTDPDGIPLGIDPPVEVQMWFSIYDQEIDGIEMWNEGPVTVTVDGGIFNVILGQTTPITPELIDGPCWLEVIVDGGGGGEYLAPRERIVSSVFAIEADNADMVDGFHADEIIATSIDGLSGGEVSGDFFVIDGSVGIGTTNPEFYKLKLLGGSASFSNEGNGFEFNIGQENIPEVGQNVGRILFKGDDDEGIPRSYAEIHTVVEDTTAGSLNSKMEFFVADDELAMSPKMVIKGSNVGIGTTTPMAKLEIKDNAVGGSTALILRNDVDVGANGEERLDFIGGTGGVRTEGRISADGGPGSYLAFHTSDPSDVLRERVRIDSSGNIGIGTTEPISMLHMSGGDILADRGTSDTSTTRILTLGGAMGLTNCYARIDFQNYDSTTGDFDYVGARISSYNDNGTDDGDLRFLTYDGSLTEQMVVSSSGNVGIGTTSPKAKLHVQDGGTAYISTNTAFQVGKDSQEHSAVVITNELGTAQTWFGYVDGCNYITGDATDTGGGSTYFRKYNESGYSDLMTVSGTGNVGIGTTDPAGLLHIRGSGPTIQVMAENNDHGDVGFTGVQNGTTAFGVFDDHSASRLRIANYKAEDIEFSTDRGNSESVIMTLKDSGNVGIGTTAPQVLLHVSGNARIDGNIAAKYQDVAEWVESSQKLMPGTVVAIDTKNSNRVVPSTFAYDTRIAGVVSKEPGLLLGEAGNGKYKISHSGRVKTKVDASFGEIEPGDLLVASKIPGVAMKSEPIYVSGFEMHRPGTILGKALESLDRGEGEILVLLSLQ